MPTDPYDYLSEPISARDPRPDPDRDPRPDPRPDNPSTVYTASIETIDNDFAGSLLGRFGL